MVRRWNLNDFILNGNHGYAAALSSAQITGEVYLYPCEEGFPECAPIGF